MARHQLQPALYNPSPTSQTALKDKAPANNKGGHNRPGVRVRAHAETDPGRITNNKVGTTTVLQWTERMANTPTMLTAHSSINNSRTQTDSKIRPTATT